MTNKATATSAKAENKARASTAPPTAGKSRSITCYIGPNIRGQLQTGQVFRGDRKAVLKQCRGLAEQHPLIKTLMVRGEALAAARRQVREPGTAYHENYQKLCRELSEAAREKEGKKNA